MLGSTHVTPGTFLDRLKPLVIYLFEVRSENNWNFRIFHTQLLSDEYIYAYKGRWLGHTLVWDFASKFFFSFFFLFHLFVFVCFFIHFSSHLNNLYKQQLLYSMYFLIEQRKDYIEVPSSKNSQLFSVRRYTYHFQYSSSVRSSSLHKSSTFTRHSSTTQYLSSSLSSWRFPSPCNQLEKSWNILASWKNWSKPRYINH